MSVAGIASSALSQLANVHRNYQQVRSEFQQLGQDLQSGNLTQAQTDFVSLSQSITTQLGSNSPTAKALNTLGQALQSGDLTAAQQAFSSLSSAKAHSHHGHGSQQQNSFTEALSQLGQALQSGNLSSAQQAFSVLQQTWQQMSSNGLTSASATPLSAAATSTGLSLTA